MENGRILGGRYQLIAEIDRGGMGQVWRAVDLRMEREVAIKVILADVSGASDSVARFLREAKAAGSLSHPGITVVHDVGEDDGRPYFVMEFLNGISLAEEIRSHPTGLAVDAVIAISIQVSAALAAAHRHGIIHRDIKPANIILLDDHLVKVCDFGIAKLADATATMSSIIGTAAYMAPEQWDNQVVQQTDLYALGCTMYALLTGSPPFCPDQPASSLMRRHHVDPPRPPRELRADIPPALESLVLDLLAKQPADRPANAGEVRTRLEDIVDNLRSSQNPATGSSGRGLVDWLRRLRRAERPDNAVPLAERTTDDLPDASADHPARTDDPPPAPDRTPQDDRWSTDSEDNLSSGESSTPESAVDDAPPSVDRPPPSEEYEYESEDGITRASSPPATEAPAVSRRGLLIGGAAVVGVAGIGWALSRSGRPAPEPVSPSPSPPPPISYPTSLIDGKHAVWSTAFDPTGRLLIIGGPNPARVLDLTVPKIKSEYFEHYAAVRAAVFSRDGLTVISCAEDGQPHRWDPGSASIISRLAGEAGPVHTWAVSDDGGLIGTAGANRLIQVWDTTTGDRILATRTDARVIAMAFHPDRRTEFVVAHARDAQVMNTDGGRLGPRLSFPAPLTDVRFNHDGSRLVLVGNHSDAMVFDRTGSAVHTLHGRHRSRIWAARYSPDGTLLATCSADHTVCLWDAATGRPLEVLEGHQGEVRCLAFNPQGSHLATGSEDATIRLWKLRTRAGQSS